MRIFLITGATIGVVGTAVGLVLGLLVAHNVEPIRKFLSWIDRREPVPVGILLPVAASLAGRDARRRRGRRAGALPVARRDHLSVVAGGAARSGRGAAL